MTCHSAQTPSLRLSHVTGRSRERNKGQTLLESKGKKKQKSRKKRTGGKKIRK
jgi:hypothetical protein